MTDAVLSIATLFTATLTVAELTHGTRAKLSIYETLTDVDDEAICDSSDEVVMVLSATN